MEHLALKYNSSLEEFCNKLCSQHNFTQFKFDHENETEWGVSHYENLIINISRPYEEGTLQEWDSSVPDNCNFGISVTSNKKIKQDSIDLLGNLLAKTFKTVVYHHRTHIRPCKNKKREGFYKNVP